MQIVSDAEVDAGGFSYSQYKAVMANDYIQAKDKDRISLI